MDHTRSRPVDEIKRMIKRLWYWMINQLPFTHEDVEGKIQRVTILAQTISWVIWQILEYVSTDINIKYPTLNILDYQTGVMGHAVITGVKTSLNYSLTYQSFWDISFFKADPTNSLERSHQLVILSSSLEHLLECSSWTILGSTEQSHIWLSFSHCCLLLCFAPFCSIFFFLAFASASWPANMILAFVYNLCFCLMFSCNCFTNKDWSHTDIYFSQSIPIFDKEQWAGFKGHAEVTGVKHTYLSIILMCSSDGAFSYLTESTNGPMVSSMAK